MDLDPKEVLTEENIKLALDRFHFHSEEDLFAAVGYQGVTALQVANKITEKIRSKQKEQDLEDSIESFQQEAASRRKASTSGVVVKGIDNVLVRLSKCCNPVPGDEIVGFITKGRGVSVHRKNCPNISKEEENRFIEVEWETDEQVRKSYSVDLEISGFDRSGFLNEILQAVNETNTSITHVTGKADQNKIATIHWTIIIAKDPMPTNRK